MLQYSDKNGANKIYGLLLNCRLISLKMKTILVTCLILILSLNFMNTPEKTPTGEEIIQLMHTKWEGKWGRNMRFDQNVYHYKNDSLIRQEVWQEILSSPKNLQIRFNGFESGNGILFKNDSVYHFEDGKLVRSEDSVHHLLLLGFDVFFLPPAETIQKLKDLGFDLSKTHEKTINSITYFIVGTGSPEDENSSQFWINKEQLYLAKVILNRNENTSEVEMKNYQFIENFPVAMEVDFKLNGKLYMKEKYFDVSFPAEVNQEIFDPKNFNKFSW